MAGILVGQPVVAGPILFITYLQHGADFTSDAAALSPSSSVLSAVPRSWRALPWRSQLSCLPHAPGE